MKKIFFPVLVALACIFSGCIKTSTVTTPVTYMNVSVGSYIFNTQTVYPAVLTQQYNDTTVTLNIIAQQLQTKEKIVLQITNYKGQSGTFSIAHHEAEASYFHYVSAGSGLSSLSIGKGGTVTITKFTADGMIGYFSFDTQDGLYLSNGTFNCPKPYYVAHHP